MMRPFLFLAACWLVGAVWGCMARAAPPPGVSSDPATHEWFQSLQRPDMPPGYPCCGEERDCRMVEYRIARDHYEAYVKRGDGPEAFPNGTNQWLAIPPEKVLKRTDNPTGKAVLCWNNIGGPGGYVFCFVTASQT